MVKVESNRDADSLKILGGFFVGLGLLVVIATFWTLGNFRAMIVNLGSGVILTTIGIAMSVVAGRLRASQDS